RSRKARTTRRSRCSSAPSGVSTVSSNRTSRWSWETWSIVPVPGTPSAGCAASKRCSTSRQARTLSFPETVIPPPTSSTRCLTVRRRTSTTGGSASFPSWIVSGGAFPWSAPHTTSRGSGRRERGLAARSSRSSTWRSSRRGILSPPHRTPTRARSPWRAKTPRFSPSAGTTTVAPGAAIRVGAVHYLRELCKGKDADPEKVADEFMHVTAGVVRSGIDVLAHPFRVFRRAALSVPERLYEPVARLLAECGVAAEVNFHTNDPDPRFFSLCLRYGVKLAFGSDAHAPWEVGEFAPHLELLHLAGYDGDVRDILWTPPPDRIARRSDRDRSQ